MAIANVTKFSMNFDRCKPFSTANFAGLLAASTALSWTVPGDPEQVYRASFGCSSNAEIWVALNATAAVPISNTPTDVSNQEFIPLGESRYVKGGDSLSFISTGTPQFSVSLLQVNPNT